MACTGGRSPTIEIRWQARATGRVDRSIHRGGMVEAGSEIDPGPPVSGIPGEARRPSSSSTHDGGCRAMSGGEEKR